MRLLSILLLFALTASGKDLAGKTTTINSEHITVMPNPVVQVGVTSGGVLVPIRADSSGVVSTAPGASSSTTAAVNTQNRTAVASAGTPQVLTGTTATLVDSVEIHARKNVTTANTGAIYLGYSSSAGSNYRVLLPGESWSITAPAGKKIDLHLIYIDSATTADAVTWTAVN